MSGLFGLSKNKDLVKRHSTTWCRATLEAQLKTISLSYILSGFLDTLKTALATAEVVTAEVVTAEVVTAEADPATVPVVTADAEPVTDPVATAKSYLLAMPMYVLYIDYIKNKVGGNIADKIVALWPTVLNDTDLVAHYGTKKAVTKQRRSPLMMEQVYREFLATTDDLMIKALLALRLTDPEWMTFSLNNDTKDLKTIPALYELLVTNQITSKLKQYSDELLALGSTTLKPTIIKLKPTIIKFPYLITSEAISDEDKQKVHDYYCSLDNNVNIITDMAYFYTTGNETSIIVSNLQQIQTYIINKDVECITRAQERWSVEGDIINETHKLLEANPSTFNLYDWIDKNEYFQNNQGGNTDETLTFTHNSKSYTIAIRLLSERYIDMWNSAVATTDTATDTATDRHITLQQVVNDIINGIENIKQVITYGDDGLPRYYEKVINKVSDIYNLVQQLPQPQQPQPQPQQPQPQPQQPQQPQPKRTD